MAAERAKSFVRIFPDAQFAPEVADVEAGPAERDETLRLWVAGWMEHCGPVTAARWRVCSDVPEAEIDNALLRIEGSGAVLRGQVHGHVRRRNGMVRAEVAGAHSSSDAGQVAQGD